LNDPASILSSRIISYGFANCIQWIKQWIQWIPRVDAVDKVDP
jgi:hypothetical protein